ncbi:MAG: Hsp20/alpha crystallin family protein [Polyangiaceae bacterium]
MSFLVPSLPSAKPDDPVGNVSPQAVPILSDGYATAQRNFPRYRLLDDATSTTLLVRVPGFARGDLSITWQNGLLEISGRARSHVPDGFGALRQGRASGDFRRTIQLSRDVVRFSADARLEHGVLTIRLQKRNPTGRTLIPLCTT